MKKYILALDQGTSSSRAIIFDKQGNVINLASKKIDIITPQPGWVEMDASEILFSTLSVINTVISNSDIDINEIDCIGITNQRETTIIWDKETGLPVYNAIVWQSRQSSSITDQLINDGYSDLFYDKTGLKINAYFSASKIRWILDNVDTKDKELMFGTVDTWLLYNLSKNKVHATDVSNASRTMLFNIKDLSWDQELLDILKIPKEILPSVKDSSYIYDVIDPNHFFGLEIPIASLCGDQQASLFGQGCLEQGMMKNTYGTGCFMLMNTGDNIVKSDNGLLTTIAWSINNQVTYAIEGSIFMAGAAIRWLKDSLQLIEDIDDTNHLKEVDSSGVYVVPAFVGLGCPYWDQEVRGSILGLNVDTTKEQVIKATLESIAYQTKDIIEIIIKESHTDLKVLKVDGGATLNEGLMQFQADILQTPIATPTNHEITALGAAYLAGLATNFYESIDDVLENLSTAKIYQPSLSSELVDTKYKKWLQAIQATLLFK